MDDARRDATPRGARGFRQAPIDPRLAQDVEVTARDKFAEVDKTDGQRIAGEKGSSEMYKRWNSASSACRNALAPPHMMMSACEHARNFYQAVW